MATATGRARGRIPRDRDNDYTREAAEARRAFVEEQTGVALQHVSGYSFDPSMLPGNMENSRASRRCRSGLQGPLLVDGEHAQGSSTCRSPPPKARWWRATAPACDYCARRAGSRPPCSMTACSERRHSSSRSAREARPSVTGYLRALPRGDQAGRGGDHPHRQAPGHRAVFGEPDPVHPLQFTSGDAAVQNFTGKATQAACNWIQAHYDGGLERYFLESNFATDKKSSQVNVLRTRGKRVVAEATLPRELIRQLMQ